MDKKSGKGLPKHKSAGRSKTDSRYWEEKIFKPVFTRDGEHIEARHYAMRVRHNGKRHTFPLGSGNKSTAGRKAAMIYTGIVTAGWDATLEKYSPSHARRDSSVTVGAVIGAVGAVTDTRPVTFTEYVKAFRRIVADIKEISSTAKLKVRRRRKIGDKMQFVTVTEERNLTMGGNSELRKHWIDRVDAVQVADIAPEDVEAWMRRYVRERAKGGNEEVEASAKRSANTVVRKARSLFSKDSVKAMKADRFDLPSPLPFDGIKYFKTEQSRYRSNVDAEELFKAAVTDLSDAQPECFKVFLLAIAGGLRRREIDTLLWDQFDAAKGTIEIRTTKYFRPKSKDSAGTVDLDKEVAAILQGFRAKAKGEFVIESDRSAKIGTSFHYYRADETFRKLFDWLAKQGIGTGDRRKDKPLHTLRKEFGSLLCQKYGLFAASRALRHSDVSVTASHYLDKKERVSVGLGALLATSDGGTNQDSTTPKKAQSQP